ncbi:MAG: ABC transporter ATP-binding protein [Cocleimonas sp.]|nr:ABC transporter ATP-binding protein [Cocleimonas sp.]
MEAFTPVLYLSSFSVFRGLMILLSIISTKGTAMTPILEIKNVTKRYGDFTAVDNVNFTVDDGGFFSILGGSGCGKTTLLRMISGFEKQTSGEIIIRGESMAGIPPELRPVNIVFQNLALFPMMDVEKNVAFGLQRQKLPKNEVSQRVADMLERVGLQGFNKKNVNDLSGGQRQRVAIARSLVLKPSILLLDEPLGALDRKLREHMKIELKLLQKEIGTTFIYITHDQSEALVMSDKVAVMNKGKFEQIDTPKNLYKNPQTSFVAGFVGESNEFDIRHYANNELTTQNGWKLSKPDLDIQPKKLFIRPEAFILSPSADLEHIERVDIKVKTILFDGSNTKISAIIKQSEDEVLISLPQNAQFENLQEGDEIEAGIHHDDLKCYQQ